MSPEAKEAIAAAWLTVLFLVGGPQEPHRLHGLWADIGHYHERRSFSEGVFLFPTVVHAYWDFDKNNKLRDIQVHRGVMSW